ncbi:hypothetical protein F443_13461 [Phytophthora nicotianae P1569]|uniref:Uncharacterized protein n=1 Tax=Phytophthora nicotianae P1569 TaxID=1317065 RepID=V9EPY0_PHYNI|nr:hypothetical protein F443_13461 [Phytophthora nicotianae P1569]
MAETINRKLKAVLAHQVKLNRALLGVIQDESALSQEKKFVFASPPTMPTRTTLAKAMFLCSRIDSSIYRITEVFQDKLSLFAFPPKRVLLAYAGFDA